MRHIKILLRVLLLPVLWLPKSAYAQSEIVSWDEVMQQMSEELVEDDDEQLWEAQQELLMELHEHPININAATRQQLLALPFLSEQTVDGILDYLALNGAMRSLGELRLVKNMSLREREWLRFFIFIPDESGVSGGRDTGFWGKSGADTTWWGRARHDALMRVDVPLYNRKGWPWKQGLASRWRYTWWQGRHLEAGLRAETDAGEAMMNRETPLWDSYGGHVQLKDIGVLKSLILGDFKVGFGEGLLMNNGLRFGKLSMGLWRTAGGVRPHRSADEVNYLRGVAATMELGKAWLLTALYSYRKLDATVAADNSVQSINTTGFHRTEGELGHRGSLGSQVTALHAAKTFLLGNDGNGLKPRAFRLGATALYQYYDHQFKQSEPLYRQILPEGYQMGGISIDYGLRSSHLYFSGETSRSFSRNARGQRGGWATLNKAAWRFSANTQLVAIQRFYSQDYYSPYASAFGENSHVQNESGFTLQLDADRVGPVAINALFDYFYSPWPRYTMSRASDGWEALMQTTFAPRRGRNLILRYSVKSKEQSDQRHYSHRLRATYEHTFSASWSAQMAAFLHRYHMATGSTTSDNSTGMALSSRADYSSRSQRLRLSVFGVLFRTDDYASRIYMYEPSLQQTFGMQQLFGRGQRLGASLRLRTKDGRWKGEMKVGVTHYADRDVIGSGFLQIASRWKGDIQVVVGMVLR